MSFENIPLEIINHIFSFLQKKKDILNTSCVCNDFSIVILDEKNKLIFEKHKKKYTNLLNELKYLMN
uniref:F-box domain-containing protein n=1 Tax=viral metagenome TaxID=1070528 RepID=A0A6C0LR52_9ZZZZ